MSFIKKCSIFIFVLFIAFGTKVTQAIQVTEANPVAYAAPKKHIEHIFVHGTHGAILGTGKISETWRSNKKFYGGRLMSGEMGLVEYKDIERDVSAPYILDTYKEILGQTNNKDADNALYLFNWSGKLSDDARKKASKDLYDALKKDGITTERWLYAHSWGGAVCAYLSEYDIKDWNIRLMMLATPIDSRTEKSIKLFCEKGGRVTLLYSYNDMIQVGDILSGTEKQTRRRVKKEALGEQASTKFTQIRIKTEGKKIGFWETQELAVRNICGGGMPFSLCLDDPTHADYWCIDWKKNNMFYSPLPVITWGPIIWSLVDRNKIQHDVDLNIKNDETNALFVMQEHIDCKQAKIKKSAPNPNPILDTYIVPLTVVKTAQDKLLAGKKHAQPGNGVDEALQMVA